MQQQPCVNQLTAPANSTLSHISICRLPEANADVKMNDRFHGLDRMQARAQADQAEQQAKPSEKGNNFAEALIDSSCYWGGSWCIAGPARGSHVESLPWVQIKNTFSKFCDSLLNKSTKIKSLMKDLEEKYDPEDAREPPAQTFLVPSNQDLPSLLI